MTLRKFAVLTSLTVFLLTSSGGAVSALAEKGPVIEPRVEQLLKETAEYLKAAKEFTFHAEITIDDVLPTGHLIQYAASQDVSVKRPNKARSVYRGDLRNSDSWYDGKTYSFLNLDRNLYSSWDAPSDIDSLLARLREELGIRIPLSTLLHADPYPSWMEGTMAGTYAGKHLVNGVPCHHLVLTQEDVDVQVWIEEGKKLVIRKVVITFKDIEQAPQFTALLTEWDFSPRLPDLLFTFVPPPDADKIKIIRKSQ